MTKHDTSTFLKRRIRNLAEQARRQPETVLMAYGYMERVRIWARMTKNADLAAATREAKDYLIEVAV